MKFIVESNKLFTQLSELNNPCVGLVSQSEDRYSLAMSAIGYCENNGSGITPQTLTSAIDKADLQLKDDFEAEDMDTLAEEGKSLTDLKKLFGNYILENNMVMLVGERGSGKTFLALLICLLIAKKAPSYLGEDIELHGNTLYINLELGRNIIAKRLASLYANLPKKEEPSNNLTTYQAKITNTRKILSIEKLKPLIEREKPVLIVIDNLRSAFRDKDAEKNNAMANLILSLAGLKDQYGFALLLLHHTKKGVTNQATNSDLQSGAGAISDFIDADFFLRKSKQDVTYRVLKRSKSRNCEEQENAKLIKFNPNTFWFDEVDDEIDEIDHIGDTAQNQGEVLKAERTKKILALHGANKSQREIAVELGISVGTVNNTINQKKKEPTTM